jgi:hypothetical protein
MLTVEQLQVVAQKPCDRGGKLRVNLEMISDPNQTLIVDHPRLKPFLIVIFKPGDRHSSVEVMHIQDVIFKKRERSLCASVINQDIARRITDFGKEAFSLHILELENILQFNAVLLALE